MIKLLFKTLNYWDIYYKRNEEILWKKILSNQILKEDFIGQKMIAH